MGKLLIVGEAAKRCSDDGATVDTWQVQSVAKRRPELFRRAGRIRVIDEDRLPELKEALRAAGYLPRNPVAPAPEEVRQ